MGAAVDPAVGLSTYSPLQMHVVVDHVDQAVREHQGGGRLRGLGRERHGGREDSAVVSHAEGTMTVQGFTGSSAVAGE